MDGAPTLGCPVVSSIARSWQDRRRLCGHRCVSTVVGHGGCDLVCGTAGGRCTKVGSVPRRIVPELSHFHWLLKINNRSN